MDIYLTENGGKGKKFAFASLPESIKVKRNTNYQTYNIISAGKIMIPRGMDSTTIGWEGVFFGPSKKNESAIVKKNLYQPPKDCVNQLAGWQQSGTPLRLLVTGSNINYDVTISTFETNDVGGYGNKEYKIELELYRPMQIYTTKELKIQSYVKKTKTRPASTSKAKKDNGKKYTVKRGDTLWGIAKKFYGKGSVWEKIYNANKSVIESTAKKYRKGKGSDHGHWIYPGEVFTIPN